MSRHMKYLDQLSALGKKNRIKVGTDCSGIEAPIEALKLMKVPYVHLWACDNDPQSEQSIMCNYKPKKFYRDIFGRDHKSLPKIDLYVAGFPCQTFSSLGKRKGFNDHRGVIFYECYQTILATQPKVFILENVKGLVTHDGGRTLATILGYLHGLKGYRFSYDVINTKDYGIPQHRERIYIVGCRSGRDFKFPKPVPLRVTIGNILERSPADPKLDQLTAHKIKLLQDLILAGKIDTLSNNWFVNLNVSSIARTGIRRDIAPCLLAGEGSNCVYYLTSVRRRLTPREYLRLQGFSDKFKICVPPRYIYKQAGNAMSVNVLCHLYHALINQRFI